MESVIYGSSDSIRLLVSCFIAGGHALIEDRPGVGKTALAKSLAKSLSVQFNRVQFTPDLMPSDITGSLVWRPGDGELVFRKGPVFTNILLGDELNRASPRVQSSLLEAMNETQVTVDGTTHTLLEPFFFIATQNPLEDAGCHTLPEAQLDRFSIKLQMGSPDPETELQLLLSRKHHDPIQELQPCLDLQESLELKQAIKNVKMDEKLSRWLIDFANLSREDEQVLRGLSPRALLQMCSMAKAWAITHQRDWVEPNDLIVLLFPVFGHRLTLKSFNQYQNMGDAQLTVLNQWLEQCPAPQ
jgi:MoxR-like ATPase